MDERRVFYRDVQMTPDWPDKIRRSQALRTMVVEGRQHPRIRFGRERPRPPDVATCHDCAVVVGEFHVPGCDVERCPACHGQLISCGCDIEPLEI